MKKFFHLIIVLAFFLTAGGCTGQDNSSDSLYTFREGSRDGIGKWYMGREIAHVMGYRGMSWLERPGREKEENTSTLLKNMDIQPDDIIADIGAGSGYHAFKMAKLAKGGLIYAVDIQDEMLAEIERKKKADNVQNVITIKGSIQEVNLRENSVDKILMVDVYHEFSHPVEMIESIIKALKKGGEVYLIEYRGEDPSVPIKKLHKMTEDQAVREMEAAGLTLVKNIDNLPWQHCMVFRRR